MAGKNKHAANKFIYFENKTKHHIEKWNHGTTLNISHVEHWMLRTLMPLQCFSFSFCWWCWCFLIRTRMEQLRSFFVDAFMSKTSLRGFLKQRVGRNQRKKTKAETKQFHFILCVACSCFLCRIFVAFVYILILFLFCSFQFQH